MYSISETNFKNIFRLIRYYATPNHRFLHAGVYDIRGIKVSKKKSANVRKKPKLWNQNNSFRRGKTMQLAILLITANEHDRDSSEEMTEGLEPGLAPITLPCC